jgi:hypothetical protein
VGQGGSVFFMRITVLLGSSSGTPFQGDGGVSGVRCENQLKKSYRSEI